MKPSFSQMNSMDSSSDIFEQNDVTQVIVEVQEPQNVEMAQQFLPQQQGQNLQPSTNRTSSIDETKSSEEL